MPRPSPQVRGRPAVWLPAPPRPRRTPLDTPSARRWPGRRAGLARGARPAGVIYANLGTVGASVDLMDSWDQTILRQDLAHLAPALSCWRSAPTRDFATAPTGRLAVSFARRRRAACRGSRRGAAGAGPCPTATVDRRGSAPPGLRRCELDRTAEPDADARRAAQRGGARERAILGLAGRDGRAVQHAPLGGDSPPMAAPDHVHLFAPAIRPPPTRCSA